MGAGWFDWLLYNMRIQYMCVCVCVSEREGEKKEALYK